MKPLFGTECYKLYLSRNFNHSNEALKAQIFTFPGGEPHVKISDPNNGTEFPEDFHHLPIRIYHTVKSFNDFGILCMAVDALRRQAPLYQLSLVLPYFPGARQDRIAEDICEPLSVKVYADLINFLVFDEVIIFDPHSNVAPALINNCVVIDNSEFVFQSRPRGEHFFLVSPDAGAAKKVEQLARYIYQKDQSFYPEIVYCTKQRHMATGELSKFKIDTEDLGGQTCVIVDDICDGGRTFKGVFDMLKAANAGDVHLIVSHGIFSGLAFENLKDFTSITTTNSWYNPTDTYMGTVKMLDIIKLHKL